MTTEEARQAAEFARAARDAAYKRAENARYNARAARDAADKAAAALVATFARAARDAAEAAKYAEDEVIDAAAEFDAADRKSRDAAVAYLNALAADNAERLKPRGVYYSRPRAS